jgi:hypothetical protein
MSNVVILPEDETSDGGEGKVTCFRGDAKTGSGVVTVNMDAVYERSKKPNVPPTGGEIAVRGESASAPIRGLRAFGVDYSGKAGTPALFVIVDKLTGGGTKEWVYHIPEKKETVVQDNVLTVKAGDCSMRAVFVAPAGVQHRPVVGDMPSAGGKGGTVVSIYRNALHFHGADPKAGDFFVVMTLQKGEAPPVKVEGSSLDAKVKVGDQTVSFDGEKIVFGK